MKKKLCIMLSLSMLCLTGCSSAENLTFEELMEEWVPAGEAEKLIVKYLEKNVD